MGSRATVLTQCLCVSVCVCARAERPLEENSWTTLQLVTVILVPCFLCAGIVLGVLIVQGHRCAYRAHKHDPEELLDDQMLMSSEKCLIDLIGDMSTSGSGSGK